MSRRGRSSSTSRGMQRAATLLLLAVLACACSIAPGFVVSNPAAAFSRQHADTGGSTAARHGGGTSSMLDSARDVVRRQRSSCLRAAEVQGGEGGGRSSAAADGVGAVAATTTTSSSAALRLGGAAGAEPASLSSQSTAPARTEIPTDVAVVGAPQQVRERVCGRHGTSAGNGFCQFCAQKCSCLLRVLHM